MDTRIYEAPELVAEIEAILNAMGGGEPLNVGAQADDAPGGVGFYL